VFPVTISLRVVLTWEGTTVDLEIRIECGTIDEYIALADWLNASRDFRGRVRQVADFPVTGGLDGGSVSSAGRCSSTMTPRFLVERSGRSRALER
jgi:hypothetical protein